MGNKKFNFNTLRESALVQQTEKNIEEGYEKLQQAGSETAQLESSVVNEAVEAVSNSQAKEGRVGDNLQKTKNVQVCMPISLYKKLAMRKMDTGDTLGNQILQALNFWLSSMEK